MSIYVGMRIEASLIISFASMNKVLVINNDVIP